jgi:hypothetical protein
MKKIILSLAVIFSLFSCTPKDATAIDKCGESKEIQFQELSNQFEYKVKSKDFSVVIIDTQEKFEKEFNTILFCGTPPLATSISTPDFAKHTLVGVSSAEKEKWTYEAKIINVEENKCEIVVSYYEHELHFGHPFFFLEIEYENPSDFVLIPKTKKSIVFKKVDFTIQDKIVGEWAWQHTTGGLAGVDETPYSTGKYKSIKITKSGNIIFFTDGIETAKMKYEIKKGISILDHQEHDMLVYGNINRVLDLPQSSKFGDLGINDNVYDGFNYTYSRIIINF